jgi:transcription initiation factor TFIIH subunit 4
MDIQGTMLMLFLVTGFLYTDFHSQGDYEYVLQYAKQLGVVMWENSVKRCFFVETTGHANLKEFISRRTQ